MLNKEYKKEMVNVNLLHSGLVYQREVTDMVRVKKIATDWCDGLFNAPSVSFSKGMYNVINGQHTIAAYKMRFGANCEIECIVGYNLTEEEENEWFYRENTKSKRQNQNTIYNSRLGKKNDLSLNSLVNDLNQVGLMLKINIPSGKNVINAIKTVEDIHNEMNSADFIVCFKLLKVTWDGELQSLKEDFIKGMVKFYNTYKGEFDNERFIKALSKINPKTIKSQVDSDVHMKNMAIRYARVFVVYYNNKLRKLPLLKISKLED